MRRRESDMSKGKDQQGITAPDSVLGPGVPAPDFKLSPLDVNPGADGILDALEALDSTREVAA